MVAVGTGIALESGVSVMPELQEHLRDVEREAREAAAKVSPWICGLARAGYAAKGVTYVLAGTLAMLAAFSYAGGRTGGTSQTLAALLDHPYGWAALVLIAAGLLGYAMWSLVLAVADPEQKGRNWSGLRKRFVYLCKGFVHLGLVAVAIGTLVGVVRSSAGRDPVEQWTGKLMSLPLGIWLVGVAGACVVWAGGFQVYRSWRPKRLDDQLMLWQFGQGLRRFLGGVGRFGVAARGLIFLLIGVFMVAAAYHADPHEAKGVGRALRYIQQQAEGRWLLTAVALGLICYGLFQFVLARYRRIDPT
jgi:hypothetical protein